MSNHYTEQNLEDHLESRLVDSGFEKIHYSKFNRQHCSIGSEFVSFVSESQPKAYEKLKKAYGDKTDEKIVQKANDEISKYGIVDFLRKGFKDRGAHIQTIFFQPNSSLNPEHMELYETNRFAVVRQLHFSRNSEKSIDVVLFINGIPIITIELKNKFTSQTIEDAKKQYDTRDHTELIFQFKRCLAHFCIDTDKVVMSTRLEKKYWMPYNKDIINPVEEGNHRTHYMWDDIFQKDSILDIIENFVMLVEEKEVEFDNVKAKVVEKKKPILIFPRYHQLDVIRKIRSEVQQNGVSRDFLIQHTTGAGKSYEIGWLAHILSSLYQKDGSQNRLFDSIIVLTDRIVLDKQLQKTIASLAQVPGVVHPVDENSQQLKKYIEQGKSIIISTVHKFPVISNSIAELKNKNFAIIIDEVHSSQSGETSKHIKKALAKGTVEPQEDDEYDDFDARIMKEILARGRQPNISYFGFTGTPKGKTLELFGDRRVEMVNGEEKVTFHPFHTYTMRQSFAEGNTLDVLEHYMTYKRFFKLNKKIAEDKSAPGSKIRQQLVNYVDLQSFTIKAKVKLILQQFVNHTAKKIKNKGRAMVVTRSRLHAVKFALELKQQMKDLGLPYSCLVAFSGKIDIDEVTHTEASINQLEPKITIPLALKDPRNRILVVANKFQTGFDEPYLHTMFVDKKLSGLQCVQTLSRLNRTSGKSKIDTFVLDFVNDWEDIHAAFQPYYQATYLDGETEPNRLYDLQREIEAFNLFTKFEMEEFVKMFYDSSVSNESAIALLEKTVVNKYNDIEKDEDKAQFKSKVQSYIRLYAFIAQIAEFEDIELEKLYIYLKFVNKALPKEKKDDFSNIINDVNLDSFRLTKTWEGKIALQGEDGAVEGLTTGGGGAPPEDPEELLSEIIKVLNTTYGADLTEEDKVHLKNVTKRIAEEADLEKTFTAPNTEENKRHAFNEALQKILLSYVNDNLDFYKNVSTGDQKDFVSDLLYQNYKRQYKSDDQVNNTRLYKLNDTDLSTIIAAEPDV